MLEKVDHDELCKLYWIAKFNTTQEFLASVCRSRGWLGKGGVPDIEGGAIIVLWDWNNGKIKYETQPPSSDQMED